MQDGSNEHLETTNSQEQQDKKDNKKETKEMDIHPKKTIDHNRSLYKQKLDDSLKSFEEVLRIIHTTNRQNQQHLKKSLIEIELIVKNAIMSLKGL